MERMLAHKSGIIGFPLRLLARENYERAVAVKGSSFIALITGEEKIIPKTARYFICTVESMPKDIKVDFVAIDEIQLAADRERGHIFSQRILESRGEMETMFLGADTAKFLIKKILPNSVVETRPRFSELKYTGRKKLLKLPPRSAVVTFSVDEVYSIAELLRRHYGGVALVLGALSPRARNAQVELYQSGEVDYLVATDAIGMGLNMDVDHVAFASLTKFDGRRRRSLDISELAQIAGRAGRYMNKGTFGTTAEADEIDKEIVSGLESHSFPSLKNFYWRNTDLVFSSVDQLISSLKKRPNSKEFVKAPVIIDQEVLEIFSKDSKLMELAVGEKNIRLLWELAQVPDYRKIRPEMHASFLNGLYLRLLSNNHKLDESWIAKRVEEVNRTDGDIYILMDRIAGIRVWSYLTNRSGWVENSSLWKKRTRDIEDRLSDALNEKLKQKFIDQRTSYLLMKLKKNESFKTSINKSGVAKIDGHSVGRLKGLVFNYYSRKYFRGRILDNLFKKTLMPKLEERARKIINDPDSVFNLTDDRKLSWNSEVIALLTKGSSIMSPKINLLADERIDAKLHNLLNRRLNNWMDSYINNLLGRVKNLEKISLVGTAKGLAFQLAESLGSLEVNDLICPIQSLSADERKTLTKNQVRFGACFIYVREILRQSSSRLLALLWIIFHQPSQLPSLPPSGRVSFRVKESICKDFYRVCGFWVVGNTAYRVDMVERFSKELRDLLRQNETILPSESICLLGVDPVRSMEIIRALGYRAAYKEKKIILIKNRSRKTSPRIGLKNLPRKGRLNFKSKKDSSLNHISSNNREDALFSNLKVLLEP